MKKRHLKFVTEVLPRLPLYIKYSGRVYRLMISHGNMRYKCQSDVLVEMNETTNLRAGEAMLEWLSENKENYTVILPKYGKF